MYLACHYEVFRMSTTSLCDNANLRWPPQTLQAGEQKTDSGSLFFPEAWLWKGITMSHSNSSEHQRTSTQTPQQFSSVSRICVFDLECYSS